MREEYTHGEMKTYYKMVRSDPAARPEEPKYIHAHRTRARTHATQYKYIQPNAGQKCLGARALPIPGGIDTFHLKEEVEPSDTMTALDAVMSVDEERARLEKEAEDLNEAVTALTEVPRRGRPRTTTA